MALPGLPLPQVNFLPEFTDFNYFLGMWYHHGPCFWIAWKVMKKPKGVGESRCGNIEVLFSLLKWMLMWVRTPTQLQQALAVTLQLDKEDFRWKPCQYQRFYRHISGKGWSENGVLEKWGWFWWYSLSSITKNRWFHYNTIKTGGHPATFSFFFFNVLNYFQYAIKKLFSKTRPKGLE